MTYWLQYNKDGDDDDDDNECNMRKQHLFSVELR